MAKSKKSFVVSGTVPENELTKFSLKGSKGRVTLVAEDNDGDTWDVATITEEGKLFLHEDQGTAYTGLANDGHDRIVVTDTLSDESDSDEDDNEF